MPPVPLSHWLVAGQVPVQLWPRHIVPEPTSNEPAGAVEPIPTLPTTCRAEFAVHVPMPTLPIETKPVCGVVVPIPTLLPKYAPPLYPIKASSVPLFLIESIFAPGVDKVFRLFKIIPTAE